MLTAECYFLLFAEFGFNQFDQFADGFVGVPAIGPDTQSHSLLCPESQHRRNALAIYYEVVFYNLYFRFILIGQLHELCRRTSVQAMYIGQRYFCLLYAQSSLPLCKAER